MEKNYTPHNPLVFPGKTEQFNDEGKLESIIVHDGMSLRDYFAAKALVGLTTHVIAEGREGLWQTKIASAAYDYADAMLAEREKQS